MHLRKRSRLACAAWSLAAVVGPVHAASFVNFESSQVHPIALTPDGAQLLAVETPDNRLAVFDVTPSGIVLAFEVPVGLEPVSVVAENDSRVWVTNHVSDSVSLVDLLTQNVVETLAVGDEPTDVVFAGNPRRAFVCVSQEDAVKIYDLANLSTSPVVVPLFGSDPRSLAVSADGQKVYVGIFESGNGTTIASSQDVLAHGGLPAPNPSGRPNVGLILRYANGHWVDETNRVFDDSHPYTLPDHDVAVLDAAQAVPVPTYLDGLGTLVFAVGVHPVTGKLYVSNTEALNHIRFEPSLRGKFVRTRMSIVDPEATSSPVIVDLNQHIDYGVIPGPQSEIDQSLSQPDALAFQPGGGVVYVAALGSAKVAVLDDAGNVTDRIPVGAGPSGLALDPTRHRLYVLNRFDATITSVDTDTHLPVALVPLRYDPSPSAVKNGRKFLYDGRLSSGHGDLACASCHAGGNLDNIAWDLGDPNGTFQPPPPNQIDPLLTGFHPMKGPMTTQSLRGLTGAQPFHWRGDRADFENFNPAFVSLMGRGQQLSSGDMQAFKDFVFSITYPPNPNQNLDRTYPNPPSGPSPERGRLAFLNTPLDGPFRCVQCHAMPTGESGQLTDRQALQAPQDMKIPQLRNLYEKTGFFVVAGPQKRGFGFTHDGSLPTLFDFLRLPVFNFGTNDALRRDIEAFLLDFDTGLAPAVGPQRTLTASNKNDLGLTTWLTTMSAQKDAGNIDLVVKGRSAGEARGWVYNGGGQFRSDRASESLVSRVDLVALADVGSELTFTGVPPGSGNRIGVDRDEDGYPDRTEIDSGSDPADPTSTPATVALGPDGGGRGARLLASFPNPASNSGTTLAFELPARRTARVRIFSATGKYVTTLHDGPAGPGVVRLRWDGTNAAGQRVASGKYFYRLEAGRDVRSSELLLLR